MGFMTLCLHVGWSSFTGNSLAWVWGRRTVLCNQERLDRALVSHSLLKIYPNRKLSDLYASVYDRFPILLTCNSHRWVGRKRKFRFENLWLSKPHIYELIRNTWKDSVGKRISEWISLCAHNLVSWSLVVIFT